MGWPSRLTDRPRAMVAQCGGGVDPKDGAAGAWTMMAQVTSHRGEEEWRRAAEACWGMGEATVTKAERAAAKEATLAAHHMLRRVVPQRLCGLCQEEEKEGEELEEEARGRGEEGGGERRRRRKRQGERGGRQREVVRTKKDKTGRGRG